MTFQVAKSMIAGVAATIIGGLILVFILRSMGLIGRENEDPVYIPDNNQKEEIAESFSFYSPKLAFFDVVGSSSVLEDRIYKDSFAAADTRYVYWELNLQHAELTQKTPVNFLVVYTRSDGSEFGKAQYENYAEVGWKSSSYHWSWGFDEPGNWPKDTYTVELFHKGNSVVKRDFVIF